MFQGRMQKRVRSRERQKSEGRRKQEGGEERGEDQMGRRDNREAASTTELQNIP